LVYLQFENKKEQGCVEKKIALKATFASHFKKTDKHVFGDVDMATHINFLELTKLLENISCSIIFHLVFYLLNIYYWFNTNSQTIFHTFSSMEFG